MDKKKMEELEKRCLEMIPKMKILIAKYIIDYNDKCDVLQEAIIAAHCNLDTLSEPYNVEAWIMTITKNKCFAWLKNYSKTENLHFSEEIGDSEQSLENEVTLDEYEHLIAGINNLSYPLRNVIQMKYFSHNSIKDISKLLNIPQGTTKRRLHDARVKFKKELSMTKKAELTKIVIEEISQKQMKIRRLGFGLNFGSPLAGIGDVEIYEAYEFPGRIFTNKFISEVTRKANIMGKEVYEVIDKSTLPKSNMQKNYYYHLDNGILSMPFRILNFPNNLKIDIDEKELLSPLECEISTGEYHNQENNETGIVDLVNITVGEKPYRPALRERYSSDDFHGRCYMEKYYSLDGREILHRNYIGKDWKMGDYITWEKWKDSPEIEFKKEKFRIWFEFVLVENYNKIDR